MVPMVKRRWWVVTLGCTGNNDGHALIQEPDYVTFLGLSGLLIVNQILIHKERDI